MCWHILSDYWPCQNAEKCTDLYYSPQNVPHVCVGAAGGGGQELSISKSLAAALFMTYSKSFLFYFDLYLRTVKVFPSLLLYLFIYQGKWPSLSRADMLITMLFDWYHWLILVSLCPFFEWIDIRSNIACCYISSCSVCNRCRVVN